MSATLDDILAELKGLRSDLAALGVSAEGVLRSVESKTVGALTVTTVSTIDQRREDEADGLTFTPLGGRSRPFKGAFKPNREAP